MLGATMEGIPILKATDLVGNRYMGQDIRCDKSHTHLQLRGHGAGGSRTAQAARYPPGMCDLILEIVASTSVPAGGDSPQHHYQHHPQIIMHHYQHHYHNFKNYHHSKNGDGRSSKTSEPLPAGG